MVQAHPARASRLLGARAPRTTASASRRPFPARVTRITEAGACAGQDAGKALVTAPFPQPSVPMEPPLPSQDRSPSPALDPSGARPPVPAGPHRPAWLRLLAAIRAALAAPRRPSAPLDDRLLRDVGLVRLRDRTGRVVLARCDEHGSGA